MVDPQLVESFLDWRYANIPPQLLAEVSIQEPSRNGNDSGFQTSSSKTPVPYGMEKGRLLEILTEIRQMIESVGDGEVDIKKVKGVDKRLRGCLNPEKIPGTALWVFQLSVSYSRALSTNGNNGIT